MGINNPKIYQTNKITNKINSIINSQVKIISKKIDSQTLAKISKDIFKNNMIVAIEIYVDNTKIIDIKKDKYISLMKKVSSDFDNFSKQTKYSLIPIHNKHLYIYFQTSTKVNNKILYKYAFKI